MNKPHQKQILTLLMITISLTLIQSAYAFLFLSLSTDKQTYLTGETAHITGNVTYGAGLVTDALVSLQVDAPGSTTMVLRTVNTGTVPNDTWPVLFTALYSCDSQGNPQTTFARDSTAYVRIKWRNYGTDPINALLALYIQYANNTPYKAFFPNGETPSPIPAQTQETFQVSIQIPGNAPTGFTRVYASAYTQKPKNDGYALCPEANTNFTIQTPSTPLPETPTPPNFTVPMYLAIAQPGTYYVYATTKYKTEGPVSTQLTFGLQPRAIPPIADFVYSPSPPGVNMNTTFDGSISLAQGYNNSIIRYEWDFGDGTPKVIKNGTMQNPPDPTATHVFNRTITYTVTLNVTDNQSLWNTTSKLIQVYSTLPPTADFTWNPQLPVSQQIITFDAGTSRPGWNGTGYTTITNYQWDFGDGHVQSTTQATITHTYPNSSYIVTLTITDSLGGQSYKIKTIIVLPPPPPGNPDINGDGKVDMTDLITVLRAFGSTPGKPTWNPIADVDQNGRVDMTDVMIVLVNFGKYV